MSKKISMVLLAAILFAATSAVAQTPPGGDQNPPQNQSSHEHAATQNQSQNQTLTNREIDRNERRDLYYLYEGPPYLVTQSYTMPAPPAATAPMAYARSFTVAQNGSLSGNLFFNNGRNADYDPDGYPTSFVPQQTLTPQGAALNVGNNGLFTYTPAPGFQGNDSFTYTLVNGAGLSATGLVTVSVTAN